ncbi:hypothetical protein HanRHA438_Chr09g0419681 [Helianthus annuus]|uniref:Uncharacterized protein n=1 Tax=Helianthus annuus TaxID=4232 RepID=A0A251TZS3_HELAN|nr:hypothetical protein HanXRQr2_Chr09g0407621 [Helianthus annuus]KAJ0527517.1 hypothetical protein HanHA300_Chr09g0334831 [Helianthus annuus]KAJ0543924.1 hypothetical protein HanHA89_Chr09g0355881 [Helianthus annuus]KAJ0708980.1 hypothetical protein HanLR1_Chr09g0335211 [Helianthus annuus]KAJ0890069.1 hypothetical protein HanRHA438_Chr09g0419681 [Helianthus annuus]
MDDSGAILCQLSALKDMLDQVNEEIEANFQITRDIESEIVKCSEFERTLAVRESELMKTMYMLQFEIKGLMAMNVTDDLLICLMCMYRILDESRARRECLQKELSCMKMKQHEILKGVEEEGHGKVGKLLAEKEYLENEVRLLGRKISSLQNSMSDFVQEILEGIDAYNSELAIVVESGNSENDKLVKEINELKATLLATMSS